MSLRSVGVPGEPAWGPSTLYQSRERVLQVVRIRAQKSWEFLGGLFANTEGVKLFVAWPQGKATSPEQMDIWKAEPIHPEEGK